MLLFLINFTLNFLLYYSVIYWLVKGGWVCNYLVAVNIIVLASGIISQFTTGNFFSPGLDDLHYAESVSGFYFLDRYEYRFWIYWLDLFVFDAVQRLDFVAIICIQNNVFLMSLGFVLLEKSGIKVPVFILFASLYFFIYLNREVVIVLGLIILFFGKGSGLKCLSFLLFFAVRPVMVLFSTCILLLKVERYRLPITFVMFGLLALKIAILRFIDLDLFDLYENYERLYQSYHEGGGKGSIILNSDFILLKWIYIALSPVPTFVAEGLTLYVAALATLIIAFYFCLMRHISHIFRGLIFSDWNYILLSHAFWALLVTNTTLDWRHMVSFTFVSLIRLHMYDKNYINK